MADEKSKDKGKKESSRSKDTGAESNLFLDSIFWVLLALVLYSVIKGMLVSFGGSSDFIPSATEIFAAIFNTVQVFSVFISLLFFIGIIYFNVKMDDLLHHEHHLARSLASNADLNREHPLNPSSASVQHKDKRWQMVTTRLNSFHEADWRLAIIESDIILSDMLSRMGYQGEHVADKLKMVEKSDFDTLDEAWEAHKVRNRIAHDGAAYHLSKQDAEKVIGLYKKVFEEFYFV
ncbi:MAG TPA: hypothetical protein VJH63_03220 [Candidatus Paceibacterota bacterium]